MISEPLLLLQPLFCTLKLLLRAEICPATKTQQLAWGCAFYLLGRMLRRCPLASELLLVVLARKQEAVRFVRGQGDLDFT